MSHNKAESLHFYNYLCHKIGSEEVVKARRLILTSQDIAVSYEDFWRLSSGSKGEGLNLNGSDFDMMLFDQRFIVYESEREAVQNHDCVLVMETEDTQPCYTYLRLFKNYKSLPHKYKQVLQKQNGKNLISSELYKSWISYTFNSERSSFQVNNIHGPCLSDKKGKFDFAFCLKCDQWVSQARQWITRARATWPSPDLISKITSCGVLFVPIGYKGSRYEHLQWRISFSIAEKLLVYSFSHTQFLCYALLKFLLKEIVERNENLKGLLCSYFLKTLMFWIAEETEPYFWRSDNIIQCFMVCLKRLLYCIEYSTLLHYFIPDNNLFYLRFNKKNRDTLISILKNSYIKGIKIFSLSQTLHDYSRFHNEITRSKSKKGRLIKEIGIFLGNEVSFSTLVGVSCCIVKEHNACNMCNTLLFHCRTGLSKCIFTNSLSDSYKMICIPHTEQINNPNNKHLYNNYRHALSQLLVGSHSDAVSGWLTLASFFYVHKHHLQTIAIINHALSKCTNEIVNPYICTFIKKQECELKMIMKERLSSVWKKIIIQKVLLGGVVLPTELKFNADRYRVYPAILFAHLLRCLSNYHLNDNVSCRQSMLQFIDIQNKWCVTEQIKFNDYFQEVALQIFRNPKLTRQLCESVARITNMFNKVMNT